MLDFEYHPYLTSYIDSLGNKKHLQYNVNNLPIREFDAFGDVAKYEYDELGRTIAVIDGAKNRTEYAYDDAGNLLTLTRADGSTVGFQYDAASHPVEVTDPNGNVWRQEWNARDKLVSQTKPLGNRTEYFYDQHGRLQSVIDARGAQSYVAVDAYGNITRFVDALGNRTEFRTDIFGNITTENSPGKRTTEYRYDAKSRLIRLTNPSGAQITCAYDNEDNLTHYKDEAGHVTKLSYRGLGEIAKRTHPDGAKVYYERDTEEQLIAVINERSQRYELKRDLRGRIVEEIDYWGGCRTYKYNKSDTLVQSKDALQRMTKFEIDALGRLKTKTLFDSKVEAFAYDANGNLLEHENADAKCTRLFDVENRLIEEKQRDIAVQNEYDAVGNRTRRVTSIGNDIYFNYNLNNQVVGVQINNEAPFRIERDDDGVAIKETLCGHLQRDYEYNPDGLLTRQHIHNQIAGFVDRKYEYDPVGNLTAKIDAQKGKTYFSYDPMGRVAKRINPMQQVETFLYDPAGDLLQSDHRFDAKSGLRKSTYKEVDYTFDVAGNLVERSGKGKAIHFEWNGNDRLIRAENESGRQTEMGYDAEGRRVFKQTDGAVTTFGWDGDHLLIDDIGQHRLGAREFVYYPGAFEPLALIEKNRHVYYYQNDPVGLPQELCYMDGQPVWSAGYEAFGEIDNFEERYVKNPLRFQGQYFDAELGLNYNRYRYFAPEIGAFISQDPLRLDAGANIYQYAPNVWGWFDPLGLICKKAKQLRAGEDVVVSSYAEADKVLFEAFPNTRKVRGAGNKDPRRVSRQKKAFKLKDDDKKRGRAVYHKDYQRSSKDSNVIAGHEELPAGHEHKTTPHINILTPEGKKNTIFIEQKR